MPNRPDIRKCAVVTGGAGFIGSHLTRALLARGFQVRVIDNESHGCRENVPDGIHYVRGDIRTPADLEAVFGPEVSLVCHCAAQVSAVGAFQNPREDLEVNVLGTLNVLQACMRHGVSRILHAGTMAVYDSGLNGEAANEAALRQPQSYYGISKLAAEQYLTVTASALARHIRVTTFRMFNVYGPLQSLRASDQGVVGVFVGAALRGEPLTIYGTGLQRRDFVYIDDVIRAWMLAVDKPDLRESAINIGSGCSHSILEVARAVLSAAGWNDPSTYRFLYRPAFAGDRDAIRCDRTLAQALLGWEPRVDFAEGLRRTVAWAREREGTL